MVNRDIKVEKRSGLATVTPNLNTVTGVSQILGLDYDPGGIFSLRSLPGGGKYVQNSEQKALPSSLKNELLG